MAKLKSPIVRLTFWICLLLGLSPSVPGQIIQLDKSFGTSGKFTTEFANAGVRTSWSSFVYPQPSGRIIVSGIHINGGQFGAPGIATCGLTAAGALDAGFGVSGKTLEMNDSVVRKIEPLPNGQFLRLRDIVVGYSPVPVLSRLNADGSLDASFVADLNIGEWMRPAAMAIRSDGKILVLLRQGPEESLWLVRLNANGGRDTSFGDNGVSFLNLKRVSNAVVGGIHVLPDNRIFIGGYYSTLGGPQGGNVAWAALLHEGGEYDRRFGLQGLVRLPFSFSIRVSKTLVQADGKIVLVGHARPDVNDHLMLVRLTQRGRRDPTFGNVGIVLAGNIRNGSVDVAHSAALMGDGRIVIVGSFGADIFSATSFLIARFGTTGQLETHAVTPFTTGQSSVAFDVAIQPDGRAIVAGYTRNPDASADGNLFAIARYTQ